MYVNIWDKVLKKWVNKTGVKRINQLDEEYFVIDGVNFFTKRYELSFIMELN